MQRMSEMTAFVIHVFVCNVVSCQFMLITSNCVYNVLMLDLFYCFYCSNHFYLTRCRHNVNLRSCSYVPCESSCKLTD